MKLSDVRYDQLNWVAKVALPALATFYVAVGALWGFPKVEEVVGTITAIDLFLGALLVKASSDYKKNNEPHAGFLTQKGVNPETTMPVLGLTIQKAPSELLENETVTFKVEQPPVGVEYEEPPAEPRA